MKKDESLQSFNIILADDDNDDRDFFKDALESSLFKVSLEFAEDGRFLTEILHRMKQLPDLIFLDLNMPHKSGGECLVEIRKTERLKNIPVIIYSTSSSLKDIDESYLNGANLYVKKPSTFNELKEIITHVLKLDWNIYKPHSARQQFLYTSKMM